MSGEFVIVTEYKRNIGATIVSEYESMLIILNSWKLYNNIVTFFEMENFFFFTEQYIFVCTYYRY